MLQGTLDDFTLPDVFRLLSYAKKTGRLDVKRSAGEGEVFFRDGEVYFARSSLSRDPLGQRLIRAGALTEGQLRKALDENAATGRRVGEILVDSGVVSPEQIEAVVRNQIEDAAFDLLRWELGEFSWEPVADADVEIQLRVSVENLVIEASRRLDELEVIKRKIPSAEAVLSMAPKPPEGAVEINITPDEWRVLVLVDGTRTVSEIGEMGGVDEFQAMRAFYGLVSAGLVEVQSRPRDEGGTPAAAASAKESAQEAPEPQAAVGVEEPAARAEPVEATGQPAEPVEATGQPAEPVAATAAPVAEREAEAAAAVEDGSLPEGSLEEPAASVAQFDAPGPDEVSTEIPDEDEGEDTFLAELLDEEAGAAEVEASPVSEDALEGPAEVVEEESPGTSTSGATPPGAVAELDRAAVVRELAGLFEEDAPPSRPTSSGRARRPTAKPSGEQAEGDKKRVEDDDQISKGLISRLIEGVKGL